MQLPAHRDIFSSATYGGVPAFSLINDQLIRVKRLINEQLTVSGKAEEINRLLVHIHSQSGKMIRPGLVLLAGRCFGKITDEHISVAAIVEMVHNATLLHDDVIDEGQIRRGKPTVNSLWGNETAVLLGDFLLSRVFRTCAKMEPRINGVIAAAAVRLCEGELRQALQRKNWQLSESEYIDVITEKSAALFSSCCYLGALLSKATEEQARALSDFGLNAGLAFQITDDLLDITGDEYKTGKTLGSDVTRHKLTLAVIHLFRTIDMKERSALVNSYFHGKDPQYDKDSLAEILGRYGSLEYARDRAQEYVTKAVQALNDLKESKAKDALIETARFMAGRTI
jgi:octaprenyl-diphosphate synthase